MTVVPSTSAHFTLPSNTSNSSTSPTSPYSPLPLEDLPLYRDDYIGLRSIDKRGGLIRGVCQGVHMEIDEQCWDSVVAYLGASGEDGPVHKELAKAVGAEESGLVFQN